MPRDRNPIDLYQYLDANFPRTTKKNFSQQEKAILRPIAEVLAMFDGNAFFGLSTDENGEDMFYEQYLPDAWRVFKANGGLKGWASEASFIKVAHHENSTVEEAYQTWQLLKILAKNNN